MRVLLIASSYAPLAGGVQTVTHDLARHLIRKGHKVQVVTNHYPRSLPVKETIDGVAVERLLFLTPDLDSLLQKRPDLFLASLFVYPYNLRRLRAIMHRFRPHIVNVHFPDHQIPFVLALRDEFDGRLIVSLHGHDIERVVMDHAVQNGSRLSRSGRWCYRRSLTKLRSILIEADAVTACSQYLLDKAIKVEPSIAGKGRAIHNGIDLTRFRNKTTHVLGRPYILALGRLVRVKGFDMLLDAFARTESEETDLIIAGDGEERRALENQTRQLKLEKRVHFFGSATPEEAVCLLNGCRFVVIPSRLESFGIVALEAMAAGKPVLATRVGGLPELLAEVQRQVGDGLGPSSSAVQVSKGEGDDVISQFATLVEPNREALAKGLSKLLHSFLHGNSFAKPRVERYSWERVVNDYEAVMAVTGE